MKPRALVVKVEGNGSAFPVDMLRYDGLSPFKETDSYTIEASLRYEKDARHRPVELIGQKEARWEPNHGRWASFGWKVTEVRAI
jgi:hypothetical protein